MHSSVLSKWFGFNVLVLLAVIAGQWENLGEIRGPYHRTDAYSESNAYRAGLSYVENGFFAHAGLPDIDYKGITFPDRESKPPPTTSDIYTHYPPGPDWLVGLSMLFLGTENLYSLRVVPMILNGLGAMIFFWLMHSVFTASFAGILCTCVLAIPIFGRFLLGLHYQGYAFTLLLIQLALVTWGMRQGRLLSRKLLAGFGALGFIQGYLSFDYCFLSTFFAVPVGLVMGARLRDLLWVVGVSGCGFVFAHTLHFLQVVLYYGSFADAYADLAQAAAHRSGAYSDLSRWEIFSEYWGKWPNTSMYLSFDLRAVTILFALWSALSLWCPLAKWSLGMRESMAWIMAFVVSFLWIVLMKDHAVVHRHFIPRHLFFVAFVMILLLQKKIYASRRFAVFRV